MMDEIDQELKKIQLLRERLAPENDLERRVLKAKTIGAVTNGVSGVIGSVRGAFVGTGRWVTRKWGWIAMVIVVIAAALGFSEWRKAERDAAEAQYRSELWAHINSKCTSERCSSPSYNFDDPVCSRELMNRSICESEARRDFHERRPRPKP